MLIRSVRILKRRIALVVAPMIVLCFTGGIRGLNVRKKALREVKHTYMLSGYDLDTALRLMASPQILEDTERSLIASGIKLRRGTLEKQFETQMAGEMSLFVTFRYADALIGERVIAEFMAQAEKSLRLTLSAPKKNKQNELATYEYQLAEADTSKNALSTELKELLAQHPMVALANGRYKSRSLETLADAVNALAIERNREELLRLELETIGETLDGLPELKTADSFIASLQALSKSVQELESRLTELRKTMTDAHPRVAKVIKERDAARTELTILEAKASAAPKLEDTPRGKMQRELAKKRTELTLLSTQIKARSAELAEQKNTVEQMARSKEREAENLSARISSLDARIIRLEGRRNIAKEALSEIMSRDVSFSLTNTAPVRILGSRFSIGMFMALGAGVGFLLGVLLAAIAEKSDPMLHETDDLKEATGIQLLAEIALPNTWPVRKSGALHALVISVVVFALLTGAILVFVYPGWEYIRASFSAPKEAGLTEEMR